MQDIVLISVRVRWLLRDQTVPSVKTANIRLVEKLGGHIFFRNIYYKAIKFIPMTELEQNIKI